MKPFCFMRYFDVCSTQSRQIIKTNVANVSACKIPVTMLKKSVLASDRWKLYATSICSIFPLWMESNSLEKSTNTPIVSWFLIPANSMVRRIVRSWEVVDRFLLNPIYIYIYIYKERERWERERPRGERERKWERSKRNELCRNYNAERNNYLIFS